ncbi:hypothetical protein ACJ41O_004720 [Fusarium nematophilum]
MPSQAPTTAPVINQLLSIRFEERACDGPGPLNLPDRKTKSTAPSPLAQSTKMELDVMMETLMAEVDKVARELKEG